MLRALHVGCGGERLPSYMAEKFQETRVDIDPRWNPDVVADARNLGEIGTFDLLYCLHVLEHFYPHEVQPVLTEWKRVTAGGGAVCIIVPNVEGVTPSDEVMYHAACGPVTAHDVIYGKREFVEHNEWMAHKNGFTPASLKKELESAGFYDVKVTADRHNLVGGGRSP